MRTDGWPAGTLLGAMPDSHRTALLKLGTTRSYRIGEILISEGAETGEVFLIQSGWVKVQTSTQSGRTTLLAVRSAGEVLGELAALDGAPRAATVIAVTITTARVIGAAAFRAYLRDRPEAELLVRANISAKLRQATRFRAEIGSGQALVRVARLLHYLAEHHGRRVPDGVALAVPLTQTEIAALVGTAEPTVQKALSELRAADLIHTGYRRLVIRDSDQLAEFAESLDAVD